MRQRAKHLDTEFQAKKEYAAKRSERLEAAAARKKYEAEQQARVQQLAPILKIVSMLSGLGNQLNEHRAKLQARSLQAVCASSMLWWCTGRVTRGWLRRAGFLPGLPGPLGR